MWVVPQLGVDVLLSPCVGGSVGMVNQSKVVGAGGKGAWISNPLCVYRTKTTHMI